MHILLADKQAEVRSALRFLLEQELGMRVVGEVAEASALLAQEAAVQPDVVLLDGSCLGCEPPICSLHCILVAALRS
jgi:DNA-binding NarL/FixJ family response regulator